MSIPYYPGSLYTPVLGLSLFGMDEVLAENMVILDTAYGSGSSINVNGTLVESPNLNGTLPAAPAGKSNVIWQYDSNGNVSAYTTGGGGSGAWATLTGDMTETQVAPWDGPTIGVPDTGISRTSAGTLAIGNGSAGDFSGTLKATIVNAVTGFQINGAATLTQYLRGNGTDFVSSAIQAADVPTLNQNTTGTAANLSGTPALPNGTTATTQVATDATTLIATDAFVQNAIDEAASSLGIPWFNLIDALDYNQVVPWYNGSPFVVDTGISRISAGVLGIGTGAQGSIAGSLSLANATHTSVNATPGTASSTAGFVLLQNTTPTVTGASTTLAISAVSTTTSGVSTYTIASTTGAGSNGWKGASITVAGFSGANTGNNGTFIVTASTTTTVVVNNASGTSAGTGTMITSAVVNSPILTLAGTVNTGTAGTLNSVADVWSIQNVLGSVAPNPTSTLTFTHSGSSGVAAVSVPNLIVSQAAGTISGNSCTLQFASGIIYTLTSSTVTLALNKNTTYSALNLASTGGLSWASGSPSSTSADTTITRNAAGIVQIGTTGSSALGNLACSSVAINGVVASPTAGVYYSGGTAGVSAGPFAAITSIQTVGGIVTVLADVSDERLKDHTPYIGGLKEILSITPIKYTWNTEGQKITGFSEDRVFVGFRAQDVQKAIPEAVTQSASNAEYLGLDDRPIVAAMINAFKEQQAQIEDLKKKINELASH